MSIRSIGTFTAGALLASMLTFTGMQSWQAGAAPGDDDSTFVPVAPCRLLNTRVRNNVGPRDTPLGPAETFPTQVTGSNGNCIGIPNDATAVAMNVTVTNGTANSFLTLFPADLTAPPRASNLNWVPGQPATPNKVDVKLSPDGKVKIYNNVGTVHVIADIVGYYTASSLTELNTELASLRTRLDALEVTASDARLDVFDSRLDAQQLTLVALASQADDRDDEIAAGEARTDALGESLARIRTQIPSLDTAPNSREVTFDGTATSVAQLDVDATTSADIVLFAFGTALENTAGENVRCVIDRDVAINDDLAHRVEWEAAGATQGSAAGEGDGAAIATSRTFVGGGTFHFVCWNPDGGTSRITGAKLTAVVFPRAPRGPAPPPPPGN